jgi:hypothetical protein
MRSSAFCLFKFNRHFVGACFLHLCGRRISEERKQCETGGPTCYLLCAGFLDCHTLHTCFMLGLFLNPEDVANTFILNVYWPSIDCVALYPRTYIGLFTCMYHILHSLLYTWSARMLDSPVQSSCCDRH